VQLGLSRVQCRASVDSASARACGIVTRVFGADRGATNGEVSFERGWPTIRVAPSPLLSFVAHAQRVVTKGREERGRSPSRAGGFHQNGAAAPQLRKVSVARRPCLRVLERASPPQQAADTGTSQALFGVDARKYPRHRALRTQGAR
jgi:hypothetical protein